MKNKLKFEKPMILEGVSYATSQGLMVMSYFEAEIEHEEASGSLTYEDFDEYWD